MIFKLRADFAAVMLVEGFFVDKAKARADAVGIYVPRCTNTFTREQFWFHSRGFTEQVSSIISIRVCLSIHPATSAWNTDCFDEIA